MTKENKNKVWGTRVKKPTSKLLQSINSSIDIDKRLFNEDIDASIAHCEMLSKQKIIKNDSAKKIIYGLKKIKIGGQTRQLINNYGYIYNILNDFTTGTDATNKNRIGQNADPSCKYYSSKSGARRRCGFPIGLISDPKSANDFDDYTIRNCWDFFKDLPVS